MRADESYRGSRWLVTGASGFIGSNLVRAGLRVGARIHAIVRSHRSYRLADIAGACVLHEADLTDREAVARVARAADPQFVFHLGMTPGHAATADARREMLLTSALGTLNLLEALSTRWPERIVHAGSGLEGATRRPAVRENDAGPTTFRGAVKAAATLLCLQAAAQNAAPIVVLRLFSVYGRWESPSRFVPAAIRAALTGDIFPLTIGGGRDFVFVDDVVDACLRAGLSQTGAGTVIDIGTGVESTNETVIRAVEQVTSRPIHLATASAAPSPVDNLRWTADTRAASRVLDWYPEHSLHQGVSQTVDWYREHPHAW